ncbi:MAG: radical SAM family heme chaperone HemW [Gammaproteobacteria bacterium]|nr:radical SAM family heme chaperone HemW [Gammaproteobacteria bacterium]
MPEFSCLPPLSLYIHIPWCVRKCPYCDFNSHAVKHEIPESQYIDCLLNDLEQQLPGIWGRRLSSIFIGGGTPSLFSAEGIHRLLSGIRARMQTVATMEITLEANPGTFEQEKFNGFYEAGINRLSIGIQSFDSDKLKRLGRIHDGREAIQAIETARKAGFENINLDLMFALPEQTIEQGLADLQTAIQLQPSHISWYQLTIEPNTYFYTHPPVTPDDELSFECQLQGQALLASAGYAQYEISAYARNGQQCKHNLNYWEFGDYLAIGAGAHGKISRADDQSIHRYWQVRKPEDYMDATLRTAGKEILSEKDRVFEFMLNALRLKQGFDLELFENHTGLSRKLIEADCATAIDSGLLTQQGNRLHATDRGYLFLNELINMFS